MTMRLTRALLIRDGLAATSGREVLRGDGLIVAPGFVDQHAHIQTTIHAHPLAENFTRQGITTILAPFSAATFVR
jgi:N-acyl-D-amino-acid deacylase